MQLLECESNAFFYDLHAPTKVLDRVFISDSYFRFLFLPYNDFERGYWYVFHCKILKFEIVIVFDYDYKFKLFLIFLVIIWNEENELVMWMKFSTNKFFREILPPTTWSVFSIV